MIVNKDNILKNINKIKWHFIDKKDFYKEVDWFGYIVINNHIVTLFIYGRELRKNTLDISFEFYHEEILDFVNNPSGDRRNIIALCNKVLVKRLNFFEHRKLIKAIKVSQKRIA